MCGLFGFAGPPSFRAATLLQALAIADQVRGEHSTGVAVAARSEGSRRLCPKLSKKALCGKEFVRSGGSRILFQEKYPLAIGHNRYATAGKVNDRNAHPFWIPRPHGAALTAHNGVVGEKGSIALRFGVRDYPVDSEVYFRAIARRAGPDEAGLVEAIEEVTQFILPRADFACLWLEPAWRSLYFWRSSGRPLAVFDARSAGLGRFLASTVEIFSDAWGSIRGCLPSLKKVTWFEARPFTLYRVKDDGSWEVDPLRKFRVPKDAPHERPAAVAPTVRQATLPWPDGASDPDPREEDEEGPRVFSCIACGGTVSEEEAIFADPQTGRRSDSGKPHHVDCVPEPPEAAWGGRPWGR